MQLVQDVAVASPEVGSAGSAAPCRESLSITDHENPSRALTIANQLHRRGITELAATIVLSQTPALDVHHYCGRKNERAVMITALADVDRFRRELEPTVWVLDMERLNLVAAVNVIARISQQTSGTLG